MKRVLSVFLLICLFVIARTATAQSIEEAGSSSGSSTPPVLVNDDVILHYDFEDDVVNGIGLSGDGAYWQAAVRFTPDELGQYYDEWGISKVIVKIHHVPDEAYVRVWEAGMFGSPGVMIYENEFDVLGAETWHEIELDTTIVLQDGLEYWVGINYYDPGTGVFPSACDGGPMVAGKGGWLQSDALADPNWAQLAGFGLDFNWRIRAVITSVVSVPGSGELPASVVLSPNYPNPFNPSTVIDFSLPNDSHVVLTVFDILGREVAKLVDNELHAGAHSVTFEASNLTSGVYFYRLQAGEEVRTNRMILQK